MLVTRVPLHERSNRRGATGPRARPNPQRPDLTKHGPRARQDGSAVPALAHLLVAGFVPVGGEKEPAGGPVECLALLLGRELGRRLDDLASLLPRDSEFRPRPAPVWQPVPLPTPEPA